MLFPPPISKQFICPALTGARENTTILTEQETQMCASLKVPPPCREHSRLSNSSSEESLQSPEPAGTELPPHYLLLSPGPRQRSGDVPELPGAAVPADALPEPLPCSLPSLGCFPQDFTPAVEQQSNRRWVCFFHSLLLEGALKSTSRAAGFSLSGSLSRSIAFGEPSRTVCFPGDTSLAGLWLYEV